MNIRKLCKQPAIISKMRRKLPVYSSAAIVAIFSGLLLTSDGMAAKDGSLGSSSSGSFTIALRVRDTVQINQLQDIRATFDENDSLTQANNKLPIVNACIYTTSGAYTLRAENNNGLQNGYPVLRGQQYQMPYRLAVTDNQGNLYSNLVQSGQQVQMQSANNAKCTDGSNLRIQMLLADDAQLAPDSYGDVVNLTVAPV